MRSGLEIMVKDEVQIMEKYIIDEKTGIGYTLRGDYYLPDLYLLQNETPMYGKYGFFESIDYTPSRLPAREKTCGS